MRTLQAQTFSPLYAQLMDQILRTVPVFSFTNRGDIASTEMLRNTLSMINRNEINDEI